jgi:pilus assembly protein CpaE
MAGLEKIRVLIVDDIAETRENLKRMLQFDQSIEVVAVARTGKEAIEVTQQLKPDVVIMDINMPDMDGIQATEMMRKKAPFTQVVILSVQNDPGYMRQAMLAGARDFLSKPPMIDELTSAIRRAGTMAQDERSKSSSFIPAGNSGGQQQTQGTYVGTGRIIVVYGPKGGSGVTTIATNLALTLNTPERKVCLVDGNLQYGDVAIFLNEQSKNNVMDLTSRVEELDPEVVKDVMITHASSGMHFLAAPPSPELAESIKGEDFGKLLQFLKRIYPYVIVDTASYLSDGVQGAIDVMDAMVLVTTQEIPAIKNSNLFLNLADKVGIRRDRIIFVMNCYNPQIAITPEKVKESLRQEVVLTIPEDERTVLNAVNKGTPFVLDNKAAPVAKKIQELANLVSERMAKLEPDEVVKKK